MRHGAGTIARRSGVRLRSAGLAVALGAALCACGAPAVRAVPEGTSRYDVLPADAADGFRGARARLLAGDAAGARGALLPLVRAHPECVPLGLWWQEAEIAAGDQADLGRASDELAAAAPSAATLVLAARAQADPQTARERLDRAEQLDPDCPWVHYGRAHLAAQQGDWAAARAALDRALAADPGQLFALRLRTWMLARDGAVEDARAELAGWLERAGNDERLPPRMVADARIDLALLDLQRGEVGDAADSLARLDPALVEPWRFHAVRACVRQEQGDLDAALDDVLAARAAAPQELLPAVQEAVLREEFLRDPARAAQAWREARALAAARDDLPAAFETLRSRVRVERLERGAPAAGSSPE
jgi:Tfp pilus assembly protein PilF